MAVRSYFAPKVDIPRSLYIGLGIASVALILALWCLLTCKT